MAITLESQNFRGLLRTKWTPSGVCVVVGPNGAGKTTLLTLFEFLRNAYLRSPSDAMSHLGGVYGLRSWRAPADEPIVVALTIGDLRWELQLVAEGPTLSERPGERLTRGQETILSRAASSKRIVHRGEEREIADNESRLALRMIVDSERPVELDTFVDVLVNNRVYRRYNLWGLQTNGSRQSGDLYLHPTGQNAFAVLRNWRDRREYKNQYNFVVSGLKAAFPDLFVELDFQVAGSTITAALIEPDGQSCPLEIAPDGWITGLLHLTAVAGAAEGSFVAIDDFGNDLHPYAIRQITTALRERAEERELTVCLASHSPVLLDEFKDAPGSVFVMARGLENRPVPLTELYDPEWLARFSLGRLYQHGEFGGQLAGNGALRQPAHRAE